MRSATFRNIGLGAIGLALAFQLGSRTARANIEDSYSRKAVAMTVYNDGTHEILYVMADDGIVWARVLWDPTTMYGPESEPGAWMSAKPIGRYFGPARDRQR